MSVTLNRTRSLYILCSVYQNMEWALNSWVFHSKITEVEEKWWCPHLCCQGDYLQVFFMCLMVSSLSLSLEMQVFSGESGDFLLFELTNFWLTSHQPPEIEVIEFLPMIIADYINRQRKVYKLKKISSVVRTLRSNASLVEMKEFEFSKVIWHNF